MCGSNISNGTYPQDLHVWFSSCWHLLCWTFSYQETCSVRNYDAQLSHLCSRLFYLQVFTVLNVRVVTVTFSKWNFLNLNIRQERDFRCHVLPYQQLSIRVEIWPRKVEAIGAPIQGPLIFETLLFSLPSAWILSCTARRVLNNHIRLRTLIGSSMELRRERNETSGEENAPITIRSSQDHWKTSCSNTVEKSNPSSRVIHFPSSHANPDVI